MDHPEGAGLQRAGRVDFDPRVRLEFLGTQPSFDGGLLVMRELDDAPKRNLTNVIDGAICIHTFDRYGTEQYEVFLQNGVLREFDLHAAVKGSNPKSYLSDSSY
jgi:hypothetical protein